MTAHRRRRGCGDDRANGRIDLLRRNVANTAHVVNDTVSFSHGMPPFGLIEIPEYADTGHAPGRAPAPSPGASRQHRFSCGLGQAAEIPLKRSTPPAEPKNTSAKSAYR